ncbi:TonB-dependent receptor [Steroidobacter sp.]|uniref:TonB-dependent receptor n=1 Tax=Steroidobacter sp. TaxID=1978227 RepID=UPI001A459192|nr:TonB-dependent receptor [Steroidobacter sp.]MBL8267842.1 TonB-dependent receptor [Steroidobacter sp.]
MGTRARRNMLAWLAAVMCACLSAVGNAQDVEKVYDFDIREQALGAALASIARQTDLIVLFPQELAGKTGMKPVVGRYTAREAIMILFRDTQFSGGLTEHGVIYISVSDTTQARIGEDDMANRQGHKSVWASVAALLFGSGVHAQGVDRDAGGGIEEIIVTAQKRSERLQDVPVPVSVVSTRALVDTNQLRLQDYATRIPGLSVGTATSGVNQTVTIRGLSSGSNPTVAILIDDVPFSGNTGPTAGLATPEIDPGDLERIEVLRGPQGTLYGASSLGGLIKYVTVDPSTEAFQGRVGVGTTSVTNGHKLGYSFRGSVNLPISESLAVGLSGFTRMEPGFVDDPVLGARGVDEQEVRGGRVSALWRPAQGWALKLNAIFQDHEAHGVSDVDVALGEFEQSRPRGGTGYEKKFQSYSATLTGQLGQFELTSITGYNRQQADFLVDLSFLSFLFGTDSNGQPVNAVAQRSRFGDIERFTQELRVATSLGSKVDALFGGYFTTQDALLTYTGQAVDRTSGAAIDNAYRFILNAPGSYEEYAGFANLTFHATERLDVQLGGRQTWIKQSDQSTTTQNIFIGGGPLVTSVGATNRANPEEFTYLLTPSFKVSPELMIYSRLASGHRVGGSNAASCLLAPVPCHYNPDRSENYEFGVKGDFLNRALTVDASLYYISWQDIQVSLVSSGISYVSNAGKAKSQGVELALEGRPLEGLTIGGWVVWNDAVLTENFPITSTVRGRRGDRLPLGMEWSGRLSVDQTFGLGKDFSGFVGAAANYVGERASAIGSTGLFNSPSYTRVDASAGVRSRSGAWAVNLFVTNLTDERGTHTGNPAAGTVIYIQPRTVGLNATHSW